MWILASFTRDGEPVTGLSPIAKVINVDTGVVVVSGASMIDKGDGFYAYDFSAYNPQRDYAIICDSVTLSGVEQFAYASSGEYNEVLDSIESTVGIVDIRTTLLRKIQTNRLELFDGDTDNWILYDDDASTPLLTFSVKDKDGDLIVQCSQSPSKRSGAAGLPSGVLSPDIYMKKSVYDPDDDGCVTCAENVSDGIYISTASGVKYAVDNSHLPCILGTKCINESNIGDGRLVSYDLASDRLVYTTLSVSGVITDHGQLSGLDGDDHPHYILESGIRPFTGTVSGIDPTQPAHLTTKFYVDTNFAPIPHTHTESDITDLLHNAVQLQGNAIDSSSPSHMDMLVWDNIDSAWEPTPINYAGGISVTFDGDTITWSGGTGLENIVEDLTPQLGGNLDTLGEIIYTTAGSTIILGPDNYNESVVLGEGTPSLYTNYVILDTTSGSERVIVWKDLEVRTGNELRFYDSNNSNYVGFEAPTLTGNQVWVLPNVDGSSGQVLTTDGAGNLSFVTATGVLTQNHSTLLGLTNDDHPQYILVDGSRGFTSTVSGVDPIQPYHLATKYYVDSISGALSSQLHLRLHSMTNTLDHYAGTNNLFYSDNSGDVQELGLGVSGTILKSTSPSAAPEWTSLSHAITDSTYHSAGPNSIFYSDNSSNIQELALEPAGEVLVTTGMSSSPAWAVLTGVGTVSVTYDGLGDEITISGSGVIDHGGLTGLSDDDHIQYILTTGVRGFTGTVSGVYPTQDYHLTTKWYVDNAITTATGNLTPVHNDLLGLQGGTAGEYYHLTSTMYSDLTSSGGIVDASSQHIHDDRYYTESEVDTISGALSTEIDSDISTHATIAGAHHAKYTDEEAQDAVGNIMFGAGSVTVIYDDAGNTITISGVDTGKTDHGNLTGLGDDDHTQYILTTGVRGFTGTVSGVDPTQLYHLTTKWYVDNAIATLSGSIILDHGALTGLEDDDHLLYVPRTGIRGFTSTVSGVDPIQDYHLTTKFYVDQQIASVSGVTDHGALTGLTYLDHPASAIYTSSGVFSDILSIADSTVQKALETIDQHDHPHTHPGDAAAVCGREPIISGSNYTTVTLPVLMSNDDYIISVGIMNEVDPEASNYAYTIGNATTSGFTVNYSGDIDSDNYLLHWAVCSGLAVSYYTKDEIDALIGINKSGKEPLSLNDTEKSVSFTSPFPNDNYTLIVSLENEVDSPSSEYAITITETTVSGFRAHFSGAMDSNNYYLNWYATSAGLGGGNYLTAVIEDASPELGGDLDLGDYSIELNTTPSGDVISGYTVGWSGDISTMTVDWNDNGFGIPLHMKNNGHWEQATAASGTTRMPCGALALEVGTGSKKILWKGIVRKGSWGWTPGDVIYVSTVDGALASTKPTASGTWVQAVGFAIASDTIRFDPGFNVGEIN